MAGEINVVSRTQIIVVPPGSNSISIINAGPPGPGGTGGPGPAPEADLIGDMHVTQVTTLTDIYGDQHVTTLTP
jgi:hypothetical protein